MTNEVEADLNASMFHESQITQAAVSESALNGLLCTTCNDTGLYEETHDGGMIVLTCDCPAGKAELEKYLEENPEER